MESQIINISECLCQKHEKKIQYFCAVSQWHFLPLCCECLPDHTQNHAKNIKVLIQGTQKVEDKYEQQRTKAIKAYSEKHAQILELIQNPKEDMDLVKLEQSRFNVLNLINKYYDNLIKELNNKKKQTQQYQSDILTRLSTNIALDIQQLKKVPQLKNIDQWIEQVKRIYFKDGAQIYIDQIQQLLQDHQKRNSEVYLLYDSSKLKKFQEDLRNSLKSMISITNPGDPNQVKKIGIKNQVKKKPQVVVKQKICKNCGSEMQYLTEWKKHLICPNCGGKERNYIHKK